MRVTLLSTYQQFGGAAVATGRLHRALQKQGVQTTWLVGTSARQEPHKTAQDVEFLANNFLAEQTAFGRFVAERLFFLPFERDQSVRFRFLPLCLGPIWTFTRLFSRPTCCTCTGSTSDFYH
jgi:hypothetical protein